MITSCCMYTLYIVHGWRRLRLSLAGFSEIADIIL